MISFYPGPSRVYQQVPQWVEEAYERSLLSVNHRSSEFAELMQKTQGLLRGSLEIPHDYSCFFTSSATECWEIIAQSLIEKRSLHLYNGAFGEKWFHYTQKINEVAKSVPYPTEKELPVEGLSKTELIALTQNETSNGTQISPTLIKQLRSLYPNTLVALDVTSSLGGIRLPWAAGDVWFASVQKCLGLPAGMGIMICSPQALDKARWLGDDRHYNSLNRMAWYMDRYQTTHTPNVMAIFLLSKVLEQHTIEDVETLVVKRHQQWMKFVDSLQILKPYVQNNQVRSSTVIALTAPPAQIDTIMEESKSNGFSLGKGYGSLKQSTLRIANFPAITTEEVNSLHAFWNSKGF